MGDEKQLTIEQVHEALDAGTDPAELRQWIDQWEEENTEGEVEDREANDDDDP